MGEELPQYCFPYRKGGAQGGLVYANASETDASGTAPASEPNAGSSGIYSTSQWNRSAAGYVQHAPMTPAVLPAPISPTQSLSPISSSSHLDRRHPRRFVTFGSQRLAAGRRRDARDEYPDPPQHRRLQRRSSLQARSHSPTASEYPSSEAPATLPFSHSPHPQSPPTSDYNSDTALADPRSLASEPAAPGYWPVTRAHHSRGYYEVPSDWQGRSLLLNEENTAPLTSSNLAILNGKTADDEQLTQNLVSTAPPANVSAQQMEARQTLAQEGSASSTNTSWRRERIGARSYGTPEPGTLIEGVKSIKSVWTKGTLD